MGSFLRLVLLLSLLSGVAVISCKTTAHSGSGVSSYGDSRYSVTHYAPGEMPVECQTPPGFSFNDGVAVVEGDDLIDGATCPGWSSGLPDCTKTLREKNLCGTIIKITFRGTVKRAWLTGICPWDHPNNASKGNWNPCGRGRKNLDLMDSIYNALGLSHNYSWGPDQSQSPWQSNPQAAYVDAVKDGHIDGVGPIK